MTGEVHGPLVDREAVERLDLVVTLNAFFTSSSATDRKKAPAVAGA